MLLESPSSTPGERLPSVTLADLDAQPVRLDSYAQGRPLLVVFSANHCPYVKHLEHALGQFAADYGDELAVVAISPNDVLAYPTDDVDGLRSQVARAHWTFPYLIDSDQSAAREFGAVCTPDFFLFDRDAVLVYRGGFDASSPSNNEPNDGRLLRAAVDAVIAGEPVPPVVKPSMGCSIKWTQ